MKLLPILFSATIFTSAFLLFFIQPLAGRMLLPTFGGSALVWNASMMFFQSLLLLGYIYAHLSIKKLGSQRQSRVHIVLMLSALFFLPLTILPDIPTVDDWPAWFVVKTLLVSIGLPFFVLSASAPMLQSWYFHSDAEDSKDPYWLYVASNFGSLLALVTYPFLLEPFLRISEQKIAWTVGYLVLIILCVGCALQVRRVPVESEQEEKSSASWKDRLIWMGLAFVPSSALLGYTSHITMDISAIPLFWVVPLALYMLSFVIVFGRRRFVSSSVYVVAAFATLFPAAYVVIMALLEPVGLLLGIQLLSLFTISLAFHSLLVDRKPHASGLTDFYVWMSVGGMLGGIFNSLIAPAVFNTMYELPLTMAIALVVLALHLPRVRFAAPSIGIKEAIKTPGMQVALLVLILGGGMLGFVAYMQSIDEIFEIPHRNLMIGAGLPFLLWYFRPLFAGIMAAVICLIVPLGFQHTNLLYQQRSVYAIHEIREFSSNIGEFNSLYHGRIQHGVQARDPKLSSIPLSYYHTTSPIGGVFEVREEIGDLSPVAALGLGVGTLAAYVKPGMEMRFFEIDPEIERIARDTRFFSYLHQCGDSCSVILGDGRLSLQQEKPGFYGLIILDAYSSDSVPVHLLSAEAIELYISLLKPEGVLMFHVSNRYVEVGQIVVNTAESLGYVAFVQDHWPRETHLDEMMVNASEWVMVGRSREELVQHTMDPRWEEAASDERAPWTDDWSNLWVYMAW